VRIVDLPVGATEDRLVGSLDIEQAIKTGTRSFEPGLIAATHRGILYIDEVNLLNDHLVDVLLDAAAMGRNYVEREGISVSHAADFILVGTMNPEEGDLRPQLLDRFGLAVEADGALAAAERREVVLRRIAYEADPYRFMAQWQEAEAQERQRLLLSQRRLPRVLVSDDILGLITDICAEYQVDGMRADIVMYKTAATIAAYEGRTEVGLEDVREAAQYTLLHRQRRQPFQQPLLVTEQLDALVQEFQSQQRPREPSSRESDAGQEPGEGDSDPSGLGDEGPAPDDPGEVDQQFEMGTPFPVRSLDLQPPDRRSRRATGRRTKTVSGSSAGKYVGSRAPQGGMADLALDATLRAAAPSQLRRRAALASADSGDVAASGPAILIEPWDVQEKVREARTGSLILFLVDASGSMGAQRRMVAVKGAILSLLLDAYQRRDRVGLISFRGPGADLLLPPTGSVDLAQVHLRDLPTGGRTPLGHGLSLALDVIERERLKDRDVLPLLVLLSDGRANVPLGKIPPPGGQPSYPGLEPRQVGASAEAVSIASLIRDRRIPAVVVDTEADFIKLGLAQPIAEAMGATYLRLEDLQAESLAQVVRLQLPATQRIASTSVH
jgi:magnesium chelatase subunit D